MRTGDSNLNPQTRPNSFAHAGEFVIGQHAQPTFKFRHWWRTDLLNVKCAAHEKRFGNLYLASVPSQTGRMRHDRDQGKLVVRRIRSKNQTRSDFRHHAEIDQPNLTWNWCGHPQLRACPTRQRRRPSPPKRTEARHVPLPTPAAGVISRAVPRAKASATQQEFRRRSHGNTTRCRVAFNCEMPKNRGSHP
jgi:hypothetical protein